MFSWALFNYFRYYGRGGAMHVNGESLCQYIESKFEGCSTALRELILKRESNVGTFLKDFEPLQATLNDAPLLVAEMSVTVLVIGLTALAGAAVKFLSTNFRPSKLASQTFNPMTTYKTQYTKADAKFVSQKHSFHILDVSPFPILVSIFLFCWLVPQTLYLHGTTLAGLPRADIIHGSLLGLYMTAMSWFLSILKEASQGFHTRRVQYGLRLGMVLFIISEVMLFFAFFWAFFHFSLVPAASIGAIWPPFGAQVVSAWGLPLVNTLLLLASGVTITIGHAYLVKNNVDAFFWYLGLTVLLGVTFLYCQAYEYKYGIKFSWRENIYGSIFFATTGLHGMHVTIGTLFLLFCWVRHLLTTILPVELKAGRGRLLNALLSPFGYDAKKGRFWAMTPDQHFGFEAAAWYWHFVDVVWLFLFVTIYWWGGAA